MKIVAGGEKYGAGGLVVFAFLTSLTLLGIVFSGWLQSDGDMELAQTGFDNARASVLKVYAIADNGEGRTGTGFLTKLKSIPVIITSKHVVKNASVIILESEQDVWAVSAWQEHSEFDLASIPFDRDIPMTALELSEGDELDIGQAVITVGYPMGDGIAVHQGNISSIDGLDIVFSAPLSAGASGSPLIDHDGKVVGICHSFANNAQNHNLAIPVALLGIGSKWEAKRAILSRDMEDYLKTITRVKIFQQKCDDAWTDVREDIPHFGKWINHTQLTRRHLLSAIEGVVLSVHSSEWGVGEGVGEIGLSGKIGKFDKAWRLHLQNIGVARDLFGIGPERIGPDSRVLTSFKESSKRLATVLLEDKNNDSPSGTNADLGLALLDYLREEDTLFRTGVP